MHNTLQYNNFKPNNKPYNNHYNNNYNNNNNNRSLNNNNTYTNKFSDNSDELSRVSKQDLLEFIYNSIDLYNLKYKILEFEDQLSLLKEKHYYVSANYNGIHSLLLFTKIKDKFYSIIIDRKTLTYNQSHINVDDVKMISIAIRLDKNIYDGTIIDGVLLYNNIDGVKNFVINDIYMFCGKYLIEEKINNKMNQITAYLDKCKVDNSFNTLSLIVNKLYNINDTNQLINDLIPRSKYNKSIKGIAFYPEISSTKLIYLYNNYRLLIYMFYLK